VSTATDSASTSFYYQLILYPRKQYPTSRTLVLYYYHYYMVV